MIHRHGPSTRADPLPTSITPMLAVAGQLPTDGEDWAFEIKWDGVRAILFVEGGRVRARAGTTWTSPWSFPELADDRGVPRDDDVRPRRRDRGARRGRPPELLAAQRRMHVANQREARRRAASDPVTSSPSTCSTSTGTRSSTALRRAPHPARVAAPLGRDLHDHGVVPRRVRRATILAAHRGKRPRGRRRQAADLAVPAGTTEPRLGQGQVLPRPRRSSSAGGRTGKGERPAASARCCSGSRTPTACATSARWGPASATERPTRLLRTAAARDERARSRPPSPARDGTGALRPARARRLRSQFGEWTTAGRLRHPTWRGCGPTRRPTRSSSE